MPGTYALTTVAKCRQYLVGTAASDEALLDRLIDVATARIEAICDRELKSRVQTEWVDGTGGDYLFLRYYPVTAISRVCADSMDALDIDCNATDATAATVYVTSTGVTLTIVGGASASSNTLTFATYATIILLEAAIEALAGWTSAITANVEHQTGANASPSSDLRQIGPIDALEQTATLQLPHHPEAEMIATLDAGRLYLPGGFPRGEKNVFVVYTAGYSTVPDDLEQACIEMVQEMFSARQVNALLKSESLGDYSRTFRDANDSGGYWRRRLAPWWRGRL